MIHELKIMEQMGFPTYFLVVWDYIRFARDNEHPRGSWPWFRRRLTGGLRPRITNIDPVSNGFCLSAFSIRNASRCLISTPISASLAVAR